MNTHALGVLEFPRVLELVAGRASSEPGATRVKSLTPGHDVAALELELSRVSAVRAIAESDQGWVSLPIPELGTALGRLRLAGASLDGVDFVAVHTTLRSSRLTKQALGEGDAPAVARAVLAPLAERLLADPRAEATIERVIAEDGSVKDGASPLLRRVRRELRGAQGDLIALLESIAQRLEPRFRVEDASVTVRNGRYVIPVRREGRSSVGGLVHDTSSSGSTLFVEPPAAIEACNRIRELEADEQAEVERLLAELTEEIRPLQPAIADSAEALTELDALYARARFAIDFRCGTVQLRPPGSGFKVMAARHPLLVEQGIEVVPFDLEMNADESTLLVSGPNTGGKTVLLKTLGLLSAMAQAALPVPVATGSTVVVYDDIFADVGDEQSIEASLSTFSAHLRNIAEILRAANERSLVLLDELGSGTDPLEGAALGGAVLEELTARRALTVATTHLGALKELAGELPGIVNASLQFDAEALGPTYVLVKGIPGRSYGISIARRLKLPEDVLRRAEERVPKAERDVNALLASLERRDTELAQTEADVRDLRESLKDRGHRLAERESRLRERERAFERESRQEARRYLLEARHEVENVIRGLKTVATDASDLLARAARRRVEALAEGHRDQLDMLEGASSEAVDVESESLSGTTRGAAVTQEPLRAGDLVHVRALGGRVGRLLELRDDECVVLVGDVKLTFELAGLTRAEGEKVSREIVAGVGGDLPDVLAVSEIDVRGQRAGDVEELVLQALDAAIRADLPWLRIIHGKGTGALRARVAEMLRKDTRVKAFRLGAWNEGGAGVTVAEL